MHWHIYLTFDEPLEDFRESLREAEEEIRRAMQYRGERVRPGMSQPLLASRWWESWLAGETHRQGE